MRRRKRKKRSISLLILAAVFAFPALGDKKKAALEPYILLNGTIFRENGFALPNADVVVIPDPAPDATRPKAKKMQTISDSQGEFAFRLPTDSMRYIIRVSVKGFRNEQKTVTVEGQEGRLDVTFQLHEEAK